MALGEAFIQVRADLRPFRRDLERELKDITDEFEKRLNLALGNKLRLEAARAGKDVGDVLGKGAEDSMRKRLGKNAPLWVDVGAAIAQLWSRGLSALPPQLKAAVVGAFLSALPLISGALAGAVGAAAGAGLAGIGAALASQFEAVQESATDTFRFIRFLLVRSAEDFESAVLSALSTLRGTFTFLRPTLERIFSISATFVEPLATSINLALESLVFSIEDVVGDLGPFVRELGAGFVILADAAGEALGILVNTGDRGTSALRDLTVIVAGLVIGTAQWVAVLTEVWGVIRQTGQAVNSMPAWIQILTPIPALLGLLTTEGDAWANTAKAVIHTNTDLVDSKGRIITVTEEEIKELEELVNASQKYHDLLISLVELEIEFERTLDDLAEALKKSSGSIALTGEAGRRAAQEIINGLEIAEKRAIERVATQRNTTEEAAALYRQEVEALRQIALESGVAAEDFNTLTGAIILAAQQRISADELGLTGVNSMLRQIVESVKRVSAAFIALSKLIPGGAALALVGIALRGFADGDIITKPTVGLMGEAGPEVVIPLTKPARAAQLAQQSGLTQMLGGGETNVFVYIGDEQLEAKMVKVVQGNNNKQALAMSQGARRF